MRAIHQNPWLLSCHLVSVSPFLFFIKYHKVLFFKKKKKLYYLIFTIEQRRQESKTPSAFQSVGFNVDFHSSYSPFMFLFTCV